MRQQAEYRRQQQEAAERERQQQQQQLAEQQRQQQLAQQQHDSSVKDTVRNIIANTDFSNFEVGSSSGGSGSLRPRSPSAGRSRVIQVGIKAMKKSFLML